MSKFPDGYKLIIHTDGTIIWTKTKKPLIVYYYTRGLHSARERLRMEDVKHEKKENAT